MGFVFLPPTSISCFPGFPVFPDFPFSRISGQRESGNTGKPRRLARCIEHSTHVCAPERYACRDDEIEDIEFGARYKSAAPDPSGWAA